LSSREQLSTRPCVSVWKLSFTPG